MGLMVYALSAYTTKPLWERGGAGVGGGRPQHLCICGAPSAEARAPRDGG